jgi:putative transcriptional regulator
MPIVINLDVVLAKQKMTLTELSQRVNITMANLSILKAGKGRAIRFSTLDAICHELGCQPGELLEYVDRETYRKLYGRDWIFEEE